MLRNRPLLIIVGLAAVLAPLVLWATLHKPAAPTVTFTTLTGQKISLRDLRGHVVLINFWATTCPGCVEEMPRIRQTWATYHARGLEVIAVAVAYDPPSYVLRFTQDNALPFAVAIDRDDRLAQAFGNVELTPTSFIIDAQGRIVQRTVGNLDFTALDHLLDAALPAKT